jgi:hypothetical protein
MRKEADDVVCLEDYALFGAIGYYYSDFRQISDQEVSEILARFPARAVDAARSCLSSSSSRVSLRPGHSPQRPHWLAGVGRLELKYPSASHVFEMS